ncbi:hypothetical protein F183_A05560 [Bryobacterales bacterium F-183]|nr:hypothetical protein F183_A05560 [Bryobacterales bacterium F-183]
MMSRNLQPLFLTALLAASLPLAAQVGSPYEPQIAELTIEGRVPLNSIFAASPGALAIPVEVLAQLQSGQLELRGRIEFNRGARILRIWQFIVPGGTPLPLPEAPPLTAPNVAVATDLHLEQIRWHQFKVTATGKTRQVVALLGRTVTRYSTTGPDEGETALISFGFEDGDPKKATFLTVHYPGEITGVIQQISADIRLEPAPLKAPQQ